MKQFTRHINYQKNKAEHLKRLGSFLSYGEGKRCITRRENGV